MNHDKKSGLLRWSFGAAWTMATRCLLALTVVSVFGAAAVHADWLVMNDGTKVETRGPWRVEGALVLFEIDSARLASVRAADVDLEASRELTEAASRAAEVQASEAATEERPKAVFVLTDADVRHAGEVPATDEPAAADMADEPAPPAAEVRVASWNVSDLPGNDGIRIVGTARNLSTAVASDLSINVLVYDSTGDLVHSGPAALGSRALGPNQSTSLASDLHGLFAYDRVEFDVDFVALERIAQPDPATATRRPEGR